MAMRCGMDNNALAWRCDAIRCGALRCVAALTKDNALRCDSLRCVARDGDASRCVAVWITMRCDAMHGDAAVGVPQITDALGARAESLRQMCNALTDYESSRLKPGKTSGSKSV